MLASTGSTVNGSRPRVSEQLLARLDDPDTAAALNTLLDHAELLAFGATAADGFLRRGDLIAENVAEGVADLRQAAGGDGGEQLGALIERLPRLAGLAVQLSELADSPQFQQTLAILRKPETLESLNALLGALAPTRPAPGDTRDPVLLGAAAHDAAASASLATSLPKLVGLAPRLLQVVDRLEPVVQSAEFDAVLRSGVFHPKTVALVGQAGDALVESVEVSRRQERGPGLMGMLRALRDADVQRAVGLLLIFAKRFGQLICR